MTSTARKPKPVGAARDTATDRATADTVVRLQRGILRLALAYHGRNAELDRKLKEFGALVRGGGRQAERQPLIDDIVSTIVTLDLEPATATAPPAAAADPDLARFLAALDAPAPLNLEIERAHRQLANVHERAAVLAQIEQLAAQISRRLRATPSLAPAEGDGNAALELARQLLSELVERLPVSSTLLERLIPLRRTLDGAQDDRRLRECVDGIATLLVDLQQEQRGEIERLGSFLRDTEQRLREFEHFVQHSRDLHLESSSDSLQLSDTLHGELQTLRADANAAADLGTMRELITVRLDNISSGLNTFVAAQKLRVLEASDSIDRMKRRLQELENQAEDLRDDLERQHARVLVDPLTGLLNRTGYNETAAKQVARWKRHGGALSLAVIDIDHFKQINDAYGHTAGDRVLSTVANKLGELIRESDLLSRYGGEEFVLLLPETGQEKARVLLDKLREHIELCPFRHKDTPVKVTLSCGVAEFKPGDVLETVFERADRAMYAAKASGRNRVCVETPGT